MVRPWSEYFGIEVEVVVVAVAVGVANVAMAINVLTGVTAWLVDVLCETDPLVETDALVDVEALVDPDTDPLADSDPADTDSLVEAEVDSEVESDVESEVESEVESDVDSDPLAEAAAEAEAARSSPADSDVLVAVSARPVVSDAADSLVESDGAADWLAAVEAVDWLAGAAAESLVAAVLRFACSELAWVLVFPLPSFLENWSPDLVVELVDSLVLCEVDSLVDSESLVALPGVRTVLPSVARVLRLSAVTSYEIGVWSDTV